MYETTFTRRVTTSTVQPDGIVGTTTEEKLLLRSDSFALAEISSFLVADPGYGDHFVGTPDIAKFEYAIKYGKDWVENLDDDPKYRGFNEEILFMVGLLTQLKDSLAEGEVLHAVRDGDETYDEFEEYDHSGNVKPYYNLEFNL